MGGADEPRGDSLVEKLHAILSDAELAQELLKDKVRTPWSRGQEWAVGSSVTREAGIIADELPSSLKPTIPGSSRSAQRWRSASSLRGRRA